MASLAPAGRRSSRGTGVPETDEGARLVLSATIDLNKFVFAVELSFH